MNASAHAGHVLRDLNQRIGGAATALVARDGAVLFADLPDGAFAETFAIMCATAFGAAVTANSELGRTAPDRVVFEGPDSRTIIVPSGGHAILVAVVDLSTDLVSASHEIRRFASLLGSP